MAFNPYFPATYQGATNQYPYQAMQQQLAALQATQAAQSAPIASGGLVWVQGIEGAKSHFVAPGQSVLLMDSESNSFFIKSADASGMPLPLRIFDYTERSTAQNAPSAPTAAVFDASGFVTRDEFEARLAQICASTEPKRRVTKKDGENNGE